MPPQAPAASESSRSQASTPAQALRVPVDAAQDLRGANLERVSLDYLFERITGDNPYQRDLAHGPWSALNVRQPGDAEQQMRRVFELPAARSFTASAWVQPFSQTSDAALDRLAGYRGPVVATSSSRFDGEPQWRASRAFDGNPGTRLDRGLAARAGVAAVVRRPRDVDPHAEAGAGRDPGAPADAGRARLARRLERPAGGRRRAVTSRCRNAVHAPPVPPRGAVGGHACRRHAGAAASGRDRRDRRRERSHAGIGAPPTSFAARMRQRGVQRSAAGGCAAGRAAPAPRSRPERRCPQRAVMRRSL